jgi:hypothetical protein
MAKDLEFELQDRPGTLADAAEAMGRAGINIDGGCGVPVDGRGVMHFLVEDADTGRQALEAAGATVTGERDVIVVPIEDRAGSLGEITRKIADAGVNVTLLYLAPGTRLVLGADDLEKARAALA